MKYFVGVVTKQVIERHIVAPISEVLSLTALARFSEKQIADIVAEPSESLRLREHLTTKLDILKEGQELFMNAMGSF